MTNDYDVLIVGAGHGGAQTAIALRQRGFAGTIALAGEEADPPYERPPLSKDYLSGGKEFERILIRPASFWTDRNIAMLNGRRAIAVDARAHRVAFDDTLMIGYRTLVWAAGGHARRLSCAGGDLRGVHSVRSRADVDQLRAELPMVARVAVIGGGYIGLEAAAVLTGLGKHVTVLEAQPRVLARVAGEPLSRFYEAEHRARGVEIRLGVIVDSLVGSSGRVVGVRLCNGEVVACDMAIVGIGIVPAVTPLLAAGAAGGDGVDIDALCRTTLPDVFAIGDCARHRSRFADDTPIRLESVQNANDMATTVAKCLTGCDEPYDAIPWFWSNQYDVKLQTVGLSAGHDETVIRGDPANRSFSVIYRRGGAVIALDCVNAVRDYVQGRALVAAGSRVEASLLADNGVALKSLL